MAWTFCTSGLAIIKAGKHTDTGIHSGAFFDEISDAIEGSIELECHSDFTTNHATLPTGIKNALSDISSSWIGMVLMDYNPVAYSAREADMIANINDDIMNKGLQKLKEKQFQKLGDPPS